MNVNIQNGSVYNSGNPKVTSVIIIYSPTEKFEPMKMPYSANLIRACMEKQVQAVKMRLCTFVKNGARFGQKIQFGSFGAKRGQIGPKIGSLYFNEKSINQNHLKCVLRGEGGGLGYFWVIFGCYA